MTRIRAILALLLLTIGCGGEPQTPSPIILIPPPPQSPAPLSTAVRVSGVAYESLPDGRRPLAGVEIFVSPGYQINPATAISDSAGRYQISGLTSAKAAECYITPASSSCTLGFIATKAGYSQPCRASFVLKTEGSFVARAEEELDLYLVPDAILSSSGVPASMPILPSSLSGLVFERTEQGPRPIAGASIMADFTYGNGWAPNARTLTDATGRYVLCNMSYAELIVEKAGFSQAARRVGADTGRADFELTRR